MVFNLERVLAPYPQIINVLQNSHTMHILDIGEKELTKTKKAEPLRFLAALQNSWVDSLIPKPWG